MSSTDIQLINFYIFNPTLTDKESAVSDDVLSLSRNIRIHVCFTGAAEAKGVVLSS